MLHLQNPVQDFADRFSCRSRDRISERFFKASSQKKRLMSKTSKSRLFILLTSSHSFGTHQAEYIKAPKEEGGGQTYEIHYVQKGEKLFSAALLQSVSTKAHSCISPELACDVTKRRISVKVIWASLILRLTFHLIWVSMTARDVHGKSGFTFSTWSN